MAEQGRISAYSVADAVGEIVLASGEIVRFGASACKEPHPFPPAVGIAVEVLAAEPHPRGGRRARRLRAVDQREVDARVASRDGTAAWRPLGPAEVGEVLAQMSEVGLVTCVVDRPLDGHAAVRALFEEAGIAGLEFRPDPHLTVGGADGPTLRLAVVNAPLDHRCVDASSASPEMLGRAFISWVPRPFVFDARGRRISRTPHEPFDAWSAWSLCAVHAALDALMPRLSGYVLHRAGDAFLPPDAWWSLGRAAAGERPVLQWVRAHVSEDGLALRTRGMEVWALPDVALHTPTEAAQAAALYVAMTACQEMAAAATMPAAGYSLTPHPDVPLTWRIESASEELIVAAPT